MRTKWRAFSVLELIIVIAILAILAAILYPVFQNAKKTAKVASCASDMRQLYAALQLYANNNDDWAPPYSTTSRWSGRNGNYIHGEPKLWRDSLIGSGAAAENFWCDLDPNRGRRNFVAMEESVGDNRALYTSLMISTNFLPRWFGSPTGALRVNLTRLPDSFPSNRGIDSPDDLIYLHDAIWQVRQNEQLQAVSAHGYRTNRLYLNGSVKHAAILDPGR